MVKESLRPCEFGCYPGALPDWTRSGVTDDEVIRVALLMLWTRRSAITFRPLAGDGQDLGLASGRLLKGGQDS
jgi:hypothetical protein